MQELLFFTRLYRDAQSTKHKTIKGIPIFKIFNGISSYPWEFFHCSDLIISLISLVVMDVSFMLGNGCLNTS